MRLAVPSALGAATGTALLLATSNDTFEAIVPGLANLLAAATYVFLAPVNAKYAICLAVASLVGGRIGANLARRMSGEVLRIGIAIAGLGVAAILAIQAFG